MFPKGEVAPAKAAIIDAGRILGYYSGKSWAHEPMMYLVVDFYNCGTRYIDSDSMQFPGTGLKWNNEVHIAQGCEEYVLPIHPVISSDGKWSLNGDRNNRVEE